MAAVAAPSTGRRLFQGDARQAADAGDGHDRYVLRGWHQNQYLFAAAAGALRTNDMTATECSPTFRLSLFFSFFSRERSIQFVCAGRVGSGELLEADVIVTATGLNLEVGGKAKFTVDGKPLVFHE